MLRGGGSHECPNCGGCKGLVGHVPFKYASYDSWRLNFLDFEAFPCSSIFAKTACLGEDDCNSW